MRNRKGINPLAVKAFIPNSDTPQYATPPNIASKTIAQAELNALTVAPEGDLTGYSRYEFDHWITISGTCNTASVGVRLNPLWTVGRGFVGGVDRSR